MTLFPSDYVQQFFSLPISCSFFSDMNRSQFVKLEREFFNGMKLNETHKNRARTEEILLTSSYVLFSQT